MTTLASVGVGHGTWGRGYALPVAGSIAAGTQTADTCQATTSAPAGGSGVWSYQWYDADTDLAISGATSRALVWTGRSASTAYRAYLIAIDTQTGLQVVSDVVEMTTAAAGAAPDVEEDFSTYTSTANLLADPRGIYNTVEDFYTGGPNGGGGAIVLDQATGYSDLSQSMRYDWTVFGSPGIGGTISRWLDIPDQSEVWIEWAHKFGPTFELDNGYTGGAAYKFLHLEVPSPSGARFGCGYENGDELAIQCDSDVDGSRVVVGSFSSERGDWHVYRWHVRIGGAGTLMEFWRDGVKKATKTGFSSAGSVMYGAALGRNINMRPVQAQSQWWGRVALWYSDPGWS